MIQKIDKDGRIIQMAYDAVNNLKKVQYGSEKVVTYEHDGLGNVIEMLDWLGTTTFERDLVGRITKVRDYKNAVSEFSYGMNGERTKIAYPSGRKAEYEYDEMGRMVGIKTEAGETKYTYNAVGKVAEELLPDGQKSLYEYDGVGNVTSLKHLDEKGNTLEERKYSYDLAGIKVSAEINKTKMGYEYDGMRRLTRVSEDGRAVEEYDYDILGNRKKMTKKRQSQGENVWYDYNKLNQLTEVWGTGARLMGREIEGKARFDYDERGNLVRICDGDKTIAEYRYDGTNRLVQSETDGKGISYDYDGLGRRTRKDDVEYVTDPMSRFNALLESSKNGEKESYVRRGHFAAAIIKDEQVRYPRRDELGSLVLVTGDGKEDRFTYDSFGALINDAKDYEKQVIHTFDGYEDDGNGLYFVQARYYMPEIGRFVEEDINHGRIENVGTLNYYAFCLNDPISRVDLDGMDSYVYYDPNLFAEGFGIEVANQQKKAIENFYGNGHVVHLVPLTVRSKFFNYWNDTMPDKVDAVAFVGHGNHNVFLLHTEFVDGVDTESKDNRYRIFSSDLTNGNMNKKNIEYLILMGCQMGDTKFDPNNFASTIAQWLAVSDNGEEQIGVQYVIASNGNITWDVSVSQKVINSGGIKSGLGFKIYRGDLDPKSLGKEYSSLQTLLNAAKNKRSSFSSYVNDSGVNVRGGAGTSNAVVTVATNKQEFTLIGSTLVDGYVWYNVEFKNADKTKGWIRSDFCILNITDANNLSNNNFSLISSGPPVANGSIGASSNTDTENSNKVKENKITEKTGVITENSGVRVRSKPNLGNTAIGFVYSGDVFEFHERVKGDEVTDNGRSSKVWYHITMKKIVNDASEVPVGRAGYVHSFFAKLN